MSSCKTVLRTSQFCHGIVKKLSAVNISLIQTFAVNSSLCSIPILIELLNQNPDSFFTINGSACDLSSFFHFDGIRIIQKNLNKYPNGTSKILK